MYRIINKTWWQSRWVRVLPDISCLASQYKFSLEKTWRTDTSAPTAWHYYLCTTTSTPLHTHVFVDIFSNSCFAKFVLVLFSSGMLPLMLILGEVGCTSPFLVGGSISKTKCDRDKLFFFCRKRGSYTDTDWVQGKYLGPIWIDNFKKHDHYCRPCIPAQVLEYPPWCYCYLPQASPLLTVLIPR